MCAAPQGKAIVNMCFLFIRRLDEPSILSVKLNSDGDVEAPLTMRDIEALKSLQTDANTVVVLPADVASLHEVALPWLNERKARTAILFAIEESLAQPVHQLQVAFDRHYYKNNQYLAAVIDKQYLESVINQLDSLTLSYQIITSAWFALNLDEACCSPEDLLIYDEAFKGTLPLKLATTYLNQRSEHLPLYCFQDSEPPPASTTCISIDMPFMLWCAKRLQKKHAMNFCQGTFERVSYRQPIRLWGMACGFLAGLWLLTFLSFNLWTLYRLHHKNTHLDAQIAAIYHEFFPEARQIISPKFRISQLLGGVSKTDKSHLWWLLDNLSSAFESNPFTLEALRFQMQTLSVTLKIPDFAQLERLQQQLKSTGMSVTQTQAASQDNQVMATLELRC